MAVYLLLRLRAGCVFLIIEFVQTRKPEVRRRRAGSRAGAGKPRELELAPGQVEAAISQSEGELGNSKASSSGVASLCSRVLHKEEVPERFYFIFPI